MQQGHTNIRALKRAESSLALVADIAAQIQWIEEDILDVMGLADAMQDVEQVYHCAGMISYDSRDRAQLMEINVEGTANVVNIALDVGVKKLLHVSSIAALGRTKKQQQLDEESHWERSKFNSNYALSKYKAEMEVWRGMQEGLPAVIVNPSVILGSGFWDSGTGKFFKNAWNEFPFYPTGGTGFVDVRDVARLMIVAMESDIVGERFVVNGENLPYQTVFNKISEAVHKKLPSVKVNFFLQEAAWRMEWLRSRLSGSRAFITRETAQHSNNTYFYDNSKSIRHLNFTYTPIFQTIEETAVQFREAAMHNFSPMVLALNNIS